MTVDEPPKKIMLKRIAHIYYKHKDLAAAKQFAIDFGFFPVEHESRPERAFFRGYGTEPFTLCLEQGDANEFLGAGFVVDSMEDLELASKTLPEATEIYDLDTPGGGKCVTFKDPYDHFPWHLVYGQQAVEPLEISFPTQAPNYVSPHRKQLACRHVLTPSSRERSSGLSTRRSDLRSGQLRFTSSATSACA